MHFCTLWTCLRPHSTVASLLVRLYPHWDARTVAGVSCAQGCYLTPVKTQVDPLLHCNGNSAETVRASTAAVSDGASSLNSSSACFWFKGFEQALPISTGAVEEVDFLMACFQLELESAIHATLPSLVLAL